MAEIITCGDDARVALPLFHAEYGGSIPTSPLQLNIEVINVHLACELNSKWHSRLPNIHWSNVVRNSHYVCFAAVYGNIYYAVAIWSSPVGQNRFKNGADILELRRLAVSPEAPQFTSSRMLMVMRKLVKKTFPDIKRLISYQDTDVHLGTIYKADNWKATSTTKGVSWTTKKRKRNIEQSLSDKIRWEFVIR